MIDVRCTETFNTVAKKWQDTPGFLQAILEAWPELKSKYASQPEQGKRGRVLMIGDEVFKIPARHREMMHPDEGIEDFNTERNTLKAMEENGMDGVPRITREKEDILLLGMTRLSGRTLPYGFEKTPNQKQMETFSNDLIDFIVRLAHALPMRNGKFAVHKDLRHANILVDPKTLRLTGVVDFGQMGYATADKWAPHWHFQGTKYYDFLVEAFARRKKDLPAPPLKKRKTPAMLNA